MPTVRGKREVRSFIAKLPEELANRVLRGAARAAANVVADEAKDRSISDEVSAAIKVATQREADRIIAKVQVKGLGAYIAPWLEYGTDPHFISVDDSQRAGMSVGRVNRLAKEGSLVINGQFVGSTVWHPGAQRHPFLRPALDIKEAEAVTAAQHYISTRVSKGGITGKDEGDEA
ncbi:HK97 gp10 family phage protein [Sphingomonas oleivorans]|nr:HK97 gp10 family phage protein [Sphingomonas oleivorans]